MNNILKNYKTVQLIAKDTIRFLKRSVLPGMSEYDIQLIAEDYMKKRGVTKYWYYGVGAFVLVKERSLLSISGRDYRSSKTDVVQRGDVITVDLSPNLQGFWGDFARTFTVGGEEKDYVKKGLDFEKKLHEEFARFVTGETTCNEVFEYINEYITKNGYKNLDFKSNLGHSIERNKDDRVYLESGNNTKLGNINFFTFEPHVSFLNDPIVAFKREDIYYFEGEMIQIL